MKKPTETWEKELRTEFKHSQFIDWSKLESFIHSQIDQERENEKKRILDIIKQFDGYDCGNPHCKDSVQAILAVINYSTALTSPTGAEGEKGEKELLIMLPPGKAGLNYIRLVTNDPTMTIKKYGELQRKKYLKFTNQDILNEEDKSLTKEGE